MKTALKIFFGTKGVNRPVVIICLLLSGLAEGLGLATLLPVLEAVQSNGVESNSILSKAVFGLLIALGIEPSLGSLLGLVAVAITLKAGLLFTALLLVGYAVADVTTSLRAKLIHKVLKVRWSYFVSQPIGRFANAISAEALRSGNAFLQAAMFVSMLIQTAVYLSIALLVSWELGLASIALGGTIALCLSGLIRMARGAGKKQTKRTRELVSQLADALAGIKALKAMARQEHLQRFFTGRITSLRKSLRREALSKQAMRNLQEPILVTILCLGFYLAITTAKTPLSELLILILLVERTVTSIGRLQQQLLKAAVQESAYQSVRQIIDESKAAKEQRLGDKTPTLEKAIEFSKVTFGYDDHKVLDNSSLTIPANRITVLTGPSGVGKTTLTDLLLGLQLPDSGEILIDGVALTQINQHAWRRMVGYVPQELFLFHQSILENVRLSDESLSEDDVIEALKLADAWQFVTAMPEGLHTIAGERGSKLSGGQRQRIALARALVHRPKLLILDEVTSALDPQAELEICSNVRRLRGDLTVISITHKPAWLTQADVVYELTPQGIYELPVAHGDAAK